MYFSAWNNNHIWDPDHLCDLFRTWTNIKTSWQIWPCDYWTNERQTCYRDLHLPLLKYENPFQIILCVCLFCFCFAEGFLCVILCVCINHSNLHSIYFFRPISFSLEFLCQSHTNTLQSIFVCAWRRTLQSYVYANHLFVCACQYYFLYYYFLYL